MKKIINGKRYDTETAKMVGEASYSNCSDFHYWSEELYRKKTGEYFLFGEGGALSKYQKEVGQNEWTGGQKIIPLTLEEAHEWGEKHLDGEVYEEIFGEVEEEKVQVSTWIEDNIKVEMDKLKDTQGSTIADIIKAGVEALS